MQLLWVQLGLLVLWVQLVLKVLKANGGGLVHKVLQGRLVLKVSQEMTVLLVFKVRLVHKGLRAHKERPDQQISLDRELHGISHRGVRATRQRSCRLRQGPA